MAEPDLQTWDAWRTQHQVFELEWWKEALANGHTGEPTEPPFWSDVEAFIQPQGAIIDIGAGPRPPFRPCVVIDPLALEYYKITPWEWWKGVAVHPTPAERRIDGLKADTIICWNCLDHTIGWRIILDNMLAYGNPNARFAVATDFQAPFLGHPGFPRDEFEAEIDKRFVIRDKREPFGRELALVMTAR
jgi:hypothetical protein